MKFIPGDIVHFYSGQAGKKKYHLCVLEVSEEGAAAFMYINSKDGYAADFVVTNKDIPCIPPSKTGKYY